MLCWKGLTRIKSNSCPCTQSRPQKSHHVPRTIVQTILQSDNGDCYWVRSENNPVLNASVCVRHLTLPLSYWWLWQFLFWARSWRECGRTMVASWLLTCDRCHGAAIIFLLSRGHNVPFCLLVLMASAFSLSEVAVCVLALLPGERSAAV